MYKHQHSAVWKTLTLKPRETPENVRLPVGPLLVPLPVWRARRTELIHREYEHGWPLGVWLTAEQGGEAIEHDIDDFTVIAIEFDKNSRAIARELREQYGYRGELRLTGDIPQGATSELLMADFDASDASDDSADPSAPSGWFNFNQTGHAGLQPAAG